MRWWMAVAVVLLLIPMVQAVETPLAADDPDDVMIHGPDGAPLTPAPSGTMKNADLTGLGILSETPEEISFYLDVVDLQPQSETNLPFADPFYYVHFRFHEVEYRIQAFLPLDNAAGVVSTGNGQPFARLQQHDGERWRSVSDAAAEPSWDTDRLTLTVPKGAIVDQDHAPIDRGAALGEIRAWSVALGFFDFSPEINGQTLPAGAPYAEDSIPDSGYTLDYEIRTGLDTQRGELFSVSDDPVRWTNGEATTLSYTVTITNRGDTDAEVTVGTEGTPSTWVTAHADTIEVPAQGSINATVLASIPFSHAHGTTQSFFAVFRDGDDFTKTRLGVHWPAIPQPAGHHDTLLLHAATTAPGFPVFDKMFPTTYDWMNAADAEVDSDDMGVPSRAMVVPSAQNAQTTASWTLALAPELRIGLDFDLTRQAMLSTSIETLAPVSDPQLTTQLVLRRVTEQEMGGGQRFSIEDTLVATGASEVLAGPQNGPLRFEVPLDVEPDADLIAYDPEANGNLVLRVQLRGVMAPGSSFGPDGTEPRLVTQGSSLQLPLFEYHDAVDAGSVTDRALVLGDADLEREVNPGKGVLYRIPVTYDGDFADTFELGITGNQADWAELVGDGVFRMSAGAERELALLVVAPENAREGDIADVTLTMRSQSNGAVEAHVRTITTVTTAKDIPDERATAQELGGELTKKESPGIGLAVLAGLGAVLVLRRR